jgi:biotin transport system substrate-specific component
MQLNGVVQYYRQAGCAIFSWIDERTILHKLILSVSFALLTGILAQIRVYLPFTPVPVTGQVFAVLLSAAILGGYYGSLSQILYVGLGAIGIPWFNGGIGGLASIMGLTGGYLIGFIPAVFIVGFLTKKFVSLRSFHFQLLLMMLGVVILYAFGAMQIAIMLNISFIQTMKIAVLPFIALDLMKATLAAGISASMLQK